MKQSSWRSSRISFALRKRTLSRDARGKLPAAAHAFVGGWKFVRAEHYAAFLAENTSLPWATRKVAERIHPTPKFRLKEGELVCETVCLGAKTVEETLVEGESTFYEPNLKVEYVVSARWEGATFVATRRSPMVNQGKPTVQRRWVDAQSGELVITQSWGAPKVFTAVYARA